MAAETGFMIDDVLYETPSLDTFTMDEAQVLYDYSGLTIEDFVADDDADADEDEAKRLAKLKNPGFMRALMHIAYQRGNPKMNAAKVKALVGSANMISSLEHLAEETEGDDALPPDSTTKPDDQSPNGSVESSESSGDDSRKSSDGPVVPLKHITTTELGTSSISPPISSVS